SLRWTCISADRPIVDEAGGADRRLPKSKPAIVGGDLRMREHGEVLLLEAANDLLEQHAILETSPAEGDGAEARAPLAVAPGELLRHRNDNLGEPFVEARGD